MSKLQQHPTFPQIYIDASHTSTSGINTGVQRVVRNACLLGGRFETQPTQTVEVQRKDFRPIDLQRQAETWKRIHDIRGDVLSVMPRSYHQVAQAVCNAIPLRFVRRWLMPEPGHQGILKLPLTIYERTLRKAELRKSNHQTVSPGVGDLLILSDAYWAKEEVWPAVAKAKANGAKVAVIIYDLIPLTHPQFVSPKGEGPFRAYLQQVAKHADMVVAISNTVCKQVEELFRTPEFRAAESCVFSSFELGAEFGVKQGKVREHIRRLFPSDANNAPHTMVATFDPRKNHLFALDAFEKVWEHYPERKLCFIGRVGWRCDNVIQRVREHPRFGTQLFALHDVTDVELHYCYQRARSVLMPSIVEGFGLPIVEALWHQRQVFASSTAIHREVGRDDCIYFELDSTEGMVNALLDWESENGAISPRRPSSYQPLTWEESIASLIGECCQLLSENELTPCRGQAA